jgi:tetratricopeptide (TPR) repeat protein
MDTVNLMQRGMELAIHGDLDQASIIFARFVRENPASEQGWLWLGRCRSVPQEKQHCFDRILAINPNNVEARRELAILASSAVSPQPLQPTLEQYSASAFPASPGVLADDQSKAPQSVPASEAQGAPSGKTWVRRTLFFLIGTLLGIILGGIIVNALVPTDIFHNLAIALALKGIHVSTVAVAPPVSTSQPQLAVTASANQPYDTRLMKAAPLIAQADALRKMGKYSDAVTVWNQALQIVPEYADGYYQRGTSYYDLTQNQRSESEYDDYLDRAREDLDEAISLNPNQGDYYFRRGQVYSSMAGVQNLRADYQKLYQVAAQSYLQGEGLPLQESWPAEKLNRLTAMVRAGDCQEAIPEVQALMGAPAYSVARLHGLLSEAYYCVGDLQNALAHVDEAYKLSPSDVCLCDRAIILYGLGRRDEAMNDIQSSLSSHPYYQGDRYYTRALFYVDRGNIDQAQKDLDIGITQTWLRGGLLSYVQGRIALAQGDKQQALMYYQDAEATYFNKGPMLDQIDRDLLALGGTPLATSTPSSDFTPMPEISATPALIAPPGLIGNP